MLRGMTWEHSRGHGSAVAASEEYTRQTGVAVHWDYRSLQAFADRPIEQIVAEYDLLVIDHPHVPLAAQAGLLAPLDGHGHDAALAHYANQSVGCSFDSYAFRGHQYGLPTDAAAQVSAVVENSSIDLPKTWEEVIELASDGVVVWPAKPIDAFSSLVTVAGTFGEAANSSPGIFLGDEVFARAMDVLHRMAELVPESNLEMNPIEVAEMLSSDGQWQYSPLLFGYTNYSRSGFRPRRLKYVDIPEGAVGSLLGGAGIAVSALSERKDLARDFAIWMMSDDVQRGVYFDGGGQPGSAVAWDDERLNAETLNFFRGTRATLEQAYVRPRTAGFIEFQDTVSPWVTLALRGQVSDRELRVRLNERASKLLTDTGGTNGNH